MAPLTVTKVRSVNPERTFGHTEDGSFFHVSALQPRGSRGFFPKVGETVCGSTEKGPKGKKFKTLYWGRTALRMLEEEREERARAANMAEIMKRPVAVLREWVYEKPTEWLDTATAVFPVDLIMGYPWEAGDVVSADDKARRVRDRDVPGDPQVHTLAPYREPISVHRGKGSYAYQHPTRDLPVYREVPLVELSAKLRYFPEIGAVGLVKTYQFPNGELFTGDKYEYTPVDWDRTPSELEVSIVPVDILLGGASAYTSNDGGTRTEGDIRQVRGTQIQATYHWKPVGFPEETEAVLRFRVEEARESLNLSKLPIWEELQVTPDPLGEFVYSEWKSGSSVEAVRCRKDLNGTLRRVARLGKY